MPGLEELTRDLRSHSDEVVNNAIRSSEGVAGLAGMIVKEERDAMRQAAMAEQAPQNPPTVREQMMGLPEIMPDMGNAPMEAIQGIGNPNLMAMNEAVMNTPRDEGEALAQGMRMGAGAVEEANRNAAMNAGIAPLPMEEEMFTAAEGGIVGFQDRGVVPGDGYSGYGDDELPDLEPIDQPWYRAPLDFVTEYPYETGLGAAGLFAARRIPVVAGALAAGKQLTKTPFAKKIAKLLKPKPKRVRRKGSTTKSKGDAKITKGEGTPDEKKGWVPKVLKGPVVRTGGTGVAIGAGLDWLGEDERPATSDLGPYTDPNQSEQDPNGTLGDISTEANKELGTDFWSADTMRKMMLFGGLNFAQGKSIGESLSEAMGLVMADDKLRQDLGLKREQIQAVKELRLATLDINKAKERRLERESALERELDPAVIELRIKDSLREYQLETLKKGPEGQKQLIDEGLMTKRGVGPKDFFSYEELQGTTQGQKMLSEVRDLVVREAVGPSGS